MPSKTTKKASATEAERTQCRPRFDAPPKPPKKKAKK